MKSFKVTSSNVQLFVNNCGSKWTIKMTNYIQFIRSQCVQIMQFIIVTNTTNLTFPSGLHTLIPANEITRRTDLVRALP
jgi:hypothetical protein